MSKIALMFSGQGAQVVGMGRDLAELYPEVQAPLARAAGGLGIDLLDVCFNGPEEVLTRTEYAQPGIYLASWLALQSLQHRVPGLEFQAAAGLSLGEFTALAAGNAFSFADGLRIVHQRGRFMQEACDATQGTMAAIMGLDVEATRAICREHDVELANLNCPGQLVISGATDGVASACDAAQAAGARKAVRLPVAGAYHSRLMGSAQPRLREVLDAVAIRTPEVEVVSNVTAQPHADPDRLRALLVDQVVSPVRWEDCIRHLIRQGCTTFIELGPGKALSNFLKRIDRNLTAFNVADAASLEAAANALTST